MLGVRALSLCACLAPVSWSTATAAPPPRCGIWWDRSLCPELRTKEDAARVWSTWTAGHVMFGVPPKPGTDVKEHPEAMTLAQWATSGWEPYSTFDLAAQAWFDRLGLLTTIAPLLREPTASALDPADFTSVVAKCFTDRATRQADSRKFSASGSPDAPQVDMDDGAFGHRFWLRAAGDLNGDGWQDWLIDHGGRAHGGTLGISGVLLVTRRGTGPLIDISNQLPDPKTGPDGLAAWCAARSTQPAWPEAKARSFTGTMLIEGRRLGITMTLTCSNTLLTGTYRYDHVGKDIPLAGSVGEQGSIMLSEFPGPNIGTATFRLEPRADGTWSGQWDDAAFDTVAEFKEGAVTLKPTR